MSTSSLSIRRVEAVLLLGLATFILATPCSRAGEPGRITGGSAAEISAAERVLIDALQGSWVATDLTFDGRPRQDAELTNSQWTFEGHELHLGSPQRGETLFRFEIDAESRPTSLHLTPIGESDEPAGWMIVAMEGERLKVGFHDNLKQRASSFDARPDMLVLTLVRLSKDHSAVAREPGLAPKR